MRTRSPKRLAWLLLKDNDDLTRGDQAFVKVQLSRPP